MNEYLYKSRMSLINLDVALLLLVSILSAFISFWLFIAFFVLLSICVISILGTRIFVYEDKIVYKAGFLIKTSEQTILMRNISLVSYSSDLLGKIFKYGDVIIATYNEKYSFSLRGMNQARMLVDNINILLEKQGKWVKK